MRKSVIAKIVFASVAASLAAGCVKDAEEPAAGQLPEPEAVVSDITCTSFKVSWKPVTDAGSYTYVFNGGEETVTRDCSVILKGLSPEQSCTFSVRADAGPNGSLTASEFVHLRVTTEGYSTLAAPEPVLVAAYMSKTIFQWNSVYGATGYEYSVGGISGKTESCSVEIGGLEGSTEYVLTMKALSDDEFVRESPEAQLKFTTLSESEDIPQIIMSQVETGPDYSRFNVYAVADARYLYFSAPASYFTKISDTQMRDWYLAAFIKALEDAGYDVAAGIRQYAGAGTASYIEYPLYPGVSYYVAAFGVGSDGKATTPLYKFTTKTLADDTPSIPDLKGEPWFSQMLFHNTNGSYNPTNSMWVNWAGQNVTEYTYLMTSTRSFQLYFGSSPELFREYVDKNGSVISDAKTLKSVNSASGLSTRFKLNAATAYTLGTLATDADGRTTFVMNSLPTKADPSYYSWAGVLLGADGDALTGLFQFSYTEEDGDMNFQVSSVRYCFCKRSELSGISTDMAPELVEAKGTDFPQSNLDIMNMTGKYSLSFGTEGAALEPDTEYILLATFTERSGDRCTTFSIGKTAAASAETKSAGLVYGTPRPRPEFHAPVVIDTYSPLVGDEF